MKISFRDELKNSKNLLAFSGGIDSTALFFLLLNNNISFDIAIVNYNIRKQSIKEVNYAKKLAKTHNKNIFIKNITLNNITNFEKVARDIRYDFFQEIVNEAKYNILITAHQLNDQLEWFLMQLTKGAGLIELLGLNEFEARRNYKIYKPLLEISKNSLEEYLNLNNIKYFVDETNHNEVIKRNYFRKKFSNELINNFEKGIQRSFAYLKNDITSLKINIKPAKVLNELEIYENHNDENLNIRIIDLCLKKKGILLSSSQRKEILKQRDITISNKINISIQNNFIWISKNIKIALDKKFKEKCRILKIPKNIRPYIYFNNINLDELIF